MTAEDQLTEREGIPIFHLSTGQGPRRGLMLHCALAHAASLGRMAGFLGDALTLTGFDMPGHGQSGDWDGEGELTQICTDIAASFLDGPTDIIGHSFGGVYALRLAVQRPDLVRSLTLIEPVFFALAGQDDPAVYTRHIDSMTPFADAMHAGDTFAAAEAFTGLWGAGPAWEKIPKLKQAMMARQMRLILATEPAILDDTGGLLQPGVLEGLTMPTLLLEGADSPEVIGVINAGLAKRLPNTRRVVVPDAGHMLPITHPQEVAGAIRGLLEESHQPAAATP